MKEITAKVSVFWKNSEIELIEYSKEDKKIWKELFQNWILANKSLEKLKSRKLNIPEWISEIAFCLETWSKRFSSKKKWDPSVSFDTFNIDRNEAEQIKACSVEYDLTSFWPRSKWDKIYFLDFYNNWNIDWTFDIYKIDTETIENTLVNKTTTFSEMQETWKRPRFSIKKKIIEEKWLKPIYKSVII